MKARRRKKSKMPTGKVTASDLPLNDDERTALSKFDYSKATFATIDPSLNSTGYAFWRLADKAKCCLPVRVGRWTSDNSHDDLTKIASLYRHLALWFRLEHCVEVHVEQPVIEQSARGVSAVGSGALLKLYHAASTCVNLAHTAAPWQGHGVWISISRWKGNLSKDMVVKRIVKRPGFDAATMASRFDLKTSDYKNDAWDAVGIGLYVKGLFNEGRSVRPKGSKR